MLRFDKMTVKAQEALQESQEIAARHEQQEIAPLHLLRALVAQADGVVPSLLTRLGVRTEALAGEIERELGWRVLRKIRRRGKTRGGGIRRRFEARERKRAAEIGGVHGAHPFRTESAAKAQGMNSAA